VNQRRIKEIIRRIIEPFEKNIGEGKKYLARERTFNKKGTFKFYKPKPSLMRKYQKSLLF
jgi:hypothetical protein